MKKFTTLVISALVALGGAQSWAQTNTLATVKIVTGTVTITDRVGTPTNQPGTVGNNLAGLAYVAGNVPGAVDTSIAFFTLTGATLPPNPADTFTSYGTLLSPTGVGSYPDVAAHVTANSYSGLTFAIDDLGLPIAGSFYTIHHRNSGDYFANIVPRTGGNSSTSDLKPMSWQGGVAGGPSDPGTSGYFGLAYASGAVTGYSANSMFYLRTDGSSHTQFGEMIPALTSASTDKIDLTNAVGSFGVGGYTTLAYSPVGFGGYAGNQFYYLRLDNVTGYTVLGRLDPSLVPGTRTISDIANLGGVFNTLNYAFDATGPAGVWGTSQLYATGARSSTAQSISFAAIANQTVGVSFTVTPSASSGLGLALTLVPSSTGSASITGPIAGVFTVKPLSPGVITLEAKQSGGAFDTNLLRQSFNATGTAVLSITTQPTSQVASTGTTANFSVVASGTAPLTYQWRKAGINISGATSSTLALANVSSGDAANYDVVVTNGSLDTLASNLVTLTVTAAAPIITNSPLTVGATVGTPFSFTITASNSPASYAASPLPAGLVINTTTGAITGTPTTVGTTAVLLGATNGGGTGNATLTIIVAAAGVAPVIANNPVVAAGTVGSPFSFAISATGSPTSYAANVLPSGLTLNTVTGVISGTPTKVEVTSVLLSATNSYGTGHTSDLTITISAAGIAPIITNNPLTAAGSVGTPFSFTIVASGSPTSFTASPLPAGLSIVAVTGVITGTPTTVGTTVVQLGAKNSTGTGTAALTITVAAAGVAPIITSPTTAPGTAGSPITTYLIVATGLPTSYSATGLPPGLTLDALTGAITGTPTTAGTYVVTITATNSSGSSSMTVTMVIAGATVTPIITSPTTAVGTVGAPFVTYQIAATGLPTGYTATGLPPGLSVNALTGAINGTPTSAGIYRVTITAINSAGTSTVTLTITVASASATPIITSPTTASAASGTTFITYLITATGTPTSYGATGLPPGLTINTLTGAINGTPTAPGNYAVTITATNALGTSTVTLTISVGPNLSSRIMNFSARALSGPGDQTLIMGFVVSGNNKNLLVRGIGPTLANFGLANALADPLLTLYDTNAAVSTNDDWSTDSTGKSQSATIAATAAQVGAFALPAGSKDSALLFTVNNGAHTTGLVRPNSTTGVALTEIYDTDTVLGSRLVNVSARMNVTAGEGTLIAGFVIGGTVSKTVLIRGVGPTLAQFGVGGLLADPQIAVYSGSTQIASNDNWETGNSTAAQISNAAAQVGAFALTAGSKDAVLLLTLQPGTYTVVVSGVGNTTGVALIEIYDTQ